MAQDAEGLKIAALELLEESMDAPDRERMERLARSAANSDAVLDSLPPRRTLAPGYYSWMNLIVECVVAPMEAGVQFRASDLDVEEMIAIQALRDARAEFKSLHPPCKGCGKPLPESGIKFCSDCERERFIAGNR